MVKNDDGFVTGSSTALPQSQGREDVHLQSILTAYQDLFQEPKGLSPPRTQDHRIPLTKGNETINM